jgi:tRNA (guanine37-N1)-methyltransferase
MKKIKGKNKDKKIKVSYYNPRDYSESVGMAPAGKLDYKRTDARPYGGGPGMVMLAEPVLKAVTAIKKKLKIAPVQYFIFSPGGQNFDNQLADKLATNKKIKNIVLICGRYEGLDARVKKILKAWRFVIVSKLMKIQKCSAGIM